MPAPTTSPASSPPARVTYSNGVVFVRDQRVFGPGGERPCERFIGRVLSVEGVRSVSLDRAQATVAIRHGVGPRGLRRLLKRLGDVIRTGAPGASIPSLPRGIGKKTCTVYRHGLLLTSCEVLSDRPGRLRLRHEALASDRAIGQEVERLMVSVPGVARATAFVWTSGLLVCYDPAVVNTPRLLQLVEDCLDRPNGWGDSLPQPALTRFRVANTSLGIAGLAEFAVPALMPVSALLLVGTNLRAFRHAWLQVRKRKFGLPVLYTVIVVATLASGQFLASALMSWLFKFWHGRLGHELATGRRLMLEECLPRPSLARLITADAGEVLVGVERLQPGDRIVVGAVETVPADGLVLGGEAILDERSVRGLDGASRKSAGDSVLAGSTVLAGRLRVEVARSGERTRASAIARALVAATSPAAGPMSPTLRAEAFAEQAVGPTLATAGVGLLIGDLTTVSAILRPDYATGPGLTVPLETLRDAALCARRGIVVCRPDIFQRLAEVDLIVLGDDPALSRVELDVAGIQTHFPEPELLRYAASAFCHLADDRATALQTACRNRRIHLLDLPPAGFGPGVTIVHSQRRVCVYEFDAASGWMGPLAVDIDGTNVGLIEFMQSGRPESASALRRIRAQASVAVALVSSRAGPDVAALAPLLGVDVSEGGFAGDDTARLLGACRQRGVRTAFVGHCQRHAAAAALAHVAVSFVDEADEYPDCAAAVLAQPRLDLFADLWEIAHKHEGRVVGAQKLVLVPNVVCVAGAFLFGFSSLAAVTMSSLATLSLFSRARSPLGVPEPRGRGRSPHSSFIRQTELGHPSPNEMRTGSHNHDTRNL